MVLEAVVGVFVPWLWQKVADGGQSRMMDSAAIENALKDAIQNDSNASLINTKKLAASAFRPAFS